MAKKVQLKKGQDFQFTKGTAAASKYPWTEWLNGDLLLLERSEGQEDDKGTVTTITKKKDYEVQTDAMPPKIKTASRRRYKVTQISRKDADGKRLGDALIIRARDMDAAERQAEDLLRAEEKEEQKARILKARQEAQAAQANGTAHAAPTGVTSAQM